MVNIELNEYSAEDMKYINELRSLGVSDDIIQITYNNTQQKRDWTENTSMWAIANGYD